MMSETSENTIFLRFYCALSMSCKTNPVKLSFRVRIQLADTDVIAVGVRIVVTVERNGRRKYTSVFVVSSRFVPWSFRSQ